MAKFTIEIEDDELNEWREYLESEGFVEKEQEDEVLISQGLEVAGLENCVVKKEVN